MDTILYMRECMDEFMVAFCMDITLFNYLLHSRVIAFCMDKQLKPLHAFQEGSAYHVHAVPIEVRDDTSGASAVVAHWAVICSCSGMADALATCLGAYTPSMSAESKQVNSQHKRMGIISTHRIVTTCTTSIILLDCNCG